MTKVSKVLTIFLSVGSLAFLAFSLARYAGGPNWEAELRAEDLQQYNFSRSDGEVPQWEVTRRFGDDTTAISGTPTPIVAQAILSARRDLETYQKNQLAAIDKQIGGDPEQNLPDLASKIEEAKKLKADDLAALQAREQQVVALLEQHEERIKQVSEQLSALSRETLSTRIEVENRREDVTRLTNQLDELRTDRYRLIELRETLTDRLIRLTVNNQVLENRNEQLKQQLKSTE